MASPKPKPTFSMSLPGGKRKSLNADNSKSSIVGEKSTRKSARGIDGRDDDHEDDDTMRKELVTSVGGGRVVTAAAEKNRGPLVIGVAPNRWEKPAAVSARKGASGVSSGTRASAATATETGVKQGKDGTSPEGNGAPPTQLPSRSSTATGDERSLDQLAAEAIVQECGGASAGYDGNNGDPYGLGLNSNRVIAMDGSGKTAAAGAAAAGGGGGGARTLLAQSMIPGLAEVDGEDAKFKHDLGYRAEDLSVRSQAYVEVPVSEFGAALLRGMGWKGPAIDGESDGAGAGRDVVPRHQRLGLGAQPKPPEEMYKGRKRKPGEKPKALEEEARKMWQQKAEEDKIQLAQSSPLSIMDIVEVNSGLSSGKKRRAMVLSTKGVPGLNKISVRLEHTGEQVDVDKSSLSKISEDEKARFPFSAGKEDSGGGCGGGRAEGGGVARETGDGGRRDTESNRKRSRSRSQSNDRDGDESSISKKDKRSKKEKKKDKKRNKRERSRGEGNKAEYSSVSDDDRKHERTNAKGNSDSHGKQRLRDSNRRGGERECPSSSGRRDDAYRDTNGSHVNGHTRASNGKYRGDGDYGRAAAASEPPWLRANIRVRVIHKTYAGGRAYLSKGRVVDVPRRGEATVRMDNGELVLEGVKERHLETVLPASGGKVVVVRGSEKGVTGKLLARDKEKGTALVQVYEDLRAITLSLDDVSEFTGMLDDDVDDVGY